jgi:metal-responsive CopG/Arc/MetJ family transcriptional regulator
LQRANLSAIVRLEDMKTILLTIEASILLEVERASLDLERTREDFIRIALARAVQQQAIISQEQKHARGYIAQPQTPEKSVSGNLNDESEAT